VAGVTERFTQTWPMSDSGYLRPRKKLLPDIFCSTSTLPRALAVASELYLALEEVGHRVTLAPSDQLYQRPDVDHREHPPKTPDYYSRDKWQPARPTIVFVGPVAIGLTLYEVSHRTEVRYVINGQYVPVTADPPARGRRGHGWSDWTTHHDLPTGRVTLRGYSPYARAEWSQHWTETTAGDLPKQLKRIVKELETEAPIISALAEEGERQAEIERQRWEVQWREHERREAERRRVQALSDSREQLLMLVDQWALAVELRASLRRRRTPRAGWSRASPPSSWTDWRVRASCWGASIRSSILTPGDRRTIACGSLTKRPTEPTLGTITACSPRPRQDFTSAPHRANVWTPAWMTTDGDFGRWRS